MFLGNDFLLNRVFYCEIELIFVKLPYDDCCIESLRSE